MHNPHRPSVLPMRAGVSPSCVVLPSTGQGRMLDALAARLPAVAAADWEQRMRLGDVVDEFGAPVTPERPFVPGIRLYYYRALAAEAAIPFAETVLYQDEHILVADKPHFLPVLPSGRYLQHTLLVRLKQRLNLPELSPVHRIDQGTAGLVLMSVQRATRGLYQGLFRDRAIDKVYEAAARWRADVAFPRTHTSRVEESAQFFRMHEVPGAPNTRTEMELAQREGGWARYRLRPVTGKRHQLRVHMAALRLPLAGDAFYPRVMDLPEGNYDHPLQLLARTLAFTDPLTGQARRFHSQRQLRPLAELDRAERERHALAAPPQRAAPL